MIQIILEGTLTRLTRYSLVGLCLAMSLLVIQLFSLGDYTMMNAVDDWIKCMLLLAAADCICVLFQSIKECNEESE